MYLFLITVLFAFLIISLSLWLASFRHEPKFHATERDFALVMNLVLTGQADYDQWSSVIHVPIRHDLRLEAVRQRCLDIEEKYYRHRSARLGKPELMFSEQGLKMIEEELNQLREQDSLTA